MDKRNGKEQVVGKRYKKNDKQNGDDTSSSTSLEKESKTRSQVAPINPAKYIKKTTSKDTVTGVIDSVAEKAEAAAEVLAEGIDVPDIPEAQGSRHRWIFILLLDLTLVGVLFGYAFMGGAVFKILEHDHNMNSFQKFVQARADLKQSIVNLSTCDPDLESINMTELNKALHIFETKMNEIVCDEKVDIKGGPVWTFWSSVFFSATVISTIGKLSIVKYIVPYIRVMTRSNDLYLNDYLLPLFFYNKTLVCLKIVEISYLLYIVIRISLIKCKEFLVTIPNGLTVAFEKLHKKFLSFLLLNFNMQIFKNR